MTDLALRNRLRAACGPFNGLTDRQLEEHIDNVTRVVEAARRSDAAALAREMKRARDRERYTRRHAA